MSRSTLLSLTAALALALAGSAQNTVKKSAFDKAWLETYVRHLWVLDPQFNVAISDPKPAADLPGFKEVTVRVSQGPASQQVVLLVSGDGSKIIEGNLYSAGSSPYKANLDKLKTQFQPSLGTPGAPVVLVEFSDFQCPHCKEEAKTIRQIVDRPPLSPRERQILAMIVLDFSNAEIARKLFVTESNVKNHLSSAFQKLGVKSRSAAAELILDRESGLGPGILHISPEESLPGIGRAVHTPDGEAPQV